MEFDDILRQIGEFGPYQRRLYVLVCLPAIFVAMQGPSSIFAMTIPRHRCALWDNDTYNDNDVQHQILLNSSIPYVKDEGHMTVSSCLVYAKDDTRQNLTEPCNRWVYDKSDFLENFASKFDLVCDRLILRSHSNMAQFAGNLVGALVMGVIADRFGRKVTLFINIAIMTLVAIITAFSPNVYVYMVLRLLHSGAAIAMFMTAFVTGLELVGPSWRVFTGVGIQLFFSIGLFILTALAYCVRRFEQLMLVISVPSVLLVILWWFIPESPRWLISRGRLQEAEVILKKAAESNGKSLPSDMIKQTHVENSGGTIVQLFTNRAMCIRTLIVMFNWFVIVMVFYGLTLNVQNLSGNIYLNFTISSAVETLGYAICIWLLDRVGRKVLHCICMLLGGLACVAVLFPVIYGGAPWLTIFLSMTGKFGASGAFAIIYVYSAELYPTVVRNSGLGISSMTGRIGGIISPYISDLGLLIGGDLKVALPQIVFGTLCVAAGLLALFLPETLNRKLPETIDDAINFGKSDVNITDWNKLKNVAAEDGIVKPKDMNNHL